MNMVRRILFSLAAAVAGVAMAVVACEAQAPASGQQEPATGAGLGTQPPAGAQQPAGGQPANGPVLKTDKAASPVELPVVVRDKKGELVTNLEKGQLTLTQDGRAQTIQSLTRADGPLRIGILVDTSRGMSGAMAAERKAAGEFLDAMLPDGTKNQAFLLHFDREVELLQDFTSARDKLHGELDDMGGTSTTRRDDSQGPETTSNPNTEGSSRHRGDDQLYDAIYLSADELMKDKAGRKVLVIFSSGADRGSKETMNDAIDAADHAGLTIYTIFFKGEQERSYNRDEFPRQRGGIGYPGGGGGYPGGGGGYPGGNPGGGRKQPEPKTASGVDGKKIMQEIANRTGGHAYEAKHTSDLDPIYKLIGDETHAQYLLAYTPDKPDTDGDFHKVVVTASEKDWTVSVPEGYYVKGSE
jgi:VWFA-related protein